MEKYGIIILAAGSSSRLGRQKQLLGYNGKTLLSHVVSAALKTVNTFSIVVIGSSNEEMQQELSQTNIHVVINHQWQHGISSSIKAGLAELLQLHPRLDACIFAVCDQPFITPQLLEALITKYEQSGKGIVAATYAGTAGTPALFSRKYFAELASLQKDEGAKPLLQKYISDLATIPFDGGEIDIDTPEDYKKLIDADR